MAGKRWNHSSKYCHNKHTEIVTLLSEEIARLVELAAAAAAGQAEEEENEKENEPAGRQRNKNT